jgi:putative RecB family exonuclease
VMPSKEDPFGPDEPSTPVKYRSVSQVKQYLPAMGGCPYQYYLQRRLRAWQRPAAWLPHGLGLHEAAEAWEKSGRTMALAEVEDVYRASYEAHTNRLAADTPNFDYWFDSGPYRGEDDIERRYRVGLEMVGKYVHYYTELAPQEVIWITPEGEPAIELEFDIDLDGVQVKGFIDQVIAEFGPRDIKSGANPGNTFQLKTYDVALDEMFEVRFGRGDYWMGKKGKPTKPYDLTGTSRQEIVDLFHEADEGIREERFDPEPESSKCFRCPVATACEFAG